MTLQERLVSEARDRFLEWDKDATKLKCKPDDLIFFVDQIILHTIEQTIKEGCEVVEGMKRDQKKKKESDPHFTGCGGCGEDYPAICGCREVNQALDDTIKALQDNK